MHCVLEGVQRRFWKHGLDQISIPNLSLFVGMSKILTNSCYFSVQVMNLGMHHKVYLTTASSGKQVNFEIGYSFIPYHF